MEKASVIKFALTILAFYLETLFQWQELQPIAKAYLCRIYSYSVNQWGLVKNSGM